MRESSLVSKGLGFAQFLFERVLGSHHNNDRIVSLADVLCLLLECAEFGSCGVQDDVSARWQRGVSGCRANKVPIVARGA